MSRVLRLFLVGAVITGVPPASGNEAGGESAASALLRTLHNAPIDVAEVDQLKVPPYNPPGPVGPAPGTGLKSVFSLPFSGEGAPQMAPVDKLVHDYLMANKIPGATVAVSKGRRLVWSKGYGYANFATKIPMQPWHRTFFGSVAKFVTALGAMKLVDDGKLKVEDLVYGKATALPGGNANDTPGVIFTPGALPDPGAYFNAMIQGVANLKTTSPSLAAGAVPTPTPNVETVLAWASKVRVKHLLSHTSGLLRNGDVDAATAYFGKSEADLTYKELHLAMLLGEAGPPFLFEPETKQRYSNHGFGLVGHIVAERSGMSYVQFIQQRILQPLGLSQMVPAYTSVGPLDAFRHTRDKNGNPQPIAHKILNAPNLGVAAGGWVGTAQDFVRLMCATDKQTAIPILSAASIDLMETVAYPAIDSDQPLGWDKRAGAGELVKDGALDGGSALIHKYVPGFISSGDHIDLSDINVAIGFNIDADNPTTLIRDIARAAGKANIPQGYDLFDPLYRCAKQPGYTVAPLPPPPAGKLAVPEAPALPRLVCNGGKAVASASIQGKATQYSCQCPAGQIAKAVGKYRNTFQCIPAAVLPVPLQLQLPQAKLTCSGGKVSGSSCICASGFNAVATGANAYRCIRSVTLPVSPAAPKSACAGGVVRANKCQCPSGQSLKNGACTATNAPQRSGTPVRVQ
ncbi:serine hydrolase domain-containing protein [Dongia deserti]|uniref:serine hydrolase domain-containing protein n=1 Tax=Dongia deserti TaxID=2268030 RepID=UPI000E64F6DD|nr:serine hydrolase domain-containing protein [Dongia deserti]